MKHAYTFLRSAVAGLALCLGLAPLAEAQTTIGRPASSRTENWGVGLRFGSPSALTIKNYLSPNSALDINIGSGIAGIYDNPYGPYRGLGFSTMINYHWRRGLGQTEGLSWYYGLGGLLQVRQYRRFDGGSRNEFRDVNRVAFGPTGALGLEYIIPGAPLSLFAEINPYVELFPSFFYIGLGGGIGGRFMF